jgi:hypothetical protein
MQKVFYTNSQKESKKNCTHHNPLSEFFWFREDSPLEHGEIITHTGDHWVRQPVITSKNM